MGRVVLETMTQEVDRHRCCPRCGRDGALRHGTDSAGRQRFRCRARAAGGCGRSFNALTATPLSRLRHSEQWGAYAHLLCDDYRSVQRLARRRELRLSPTTIFRWRHRFLQALKEVGDRRLEGIVEADETFFRRSFKGHRGWKRGTPPIARKPRHHGGPLHLRGLSHLLAPVETAVDRGGGEFNRVLQSRADVVHTLRTRIAPGSVLCSDGFAGYRRVAMEAGAEHYRFRQNHPEDLDHEAVVRNDSATLSLGRVNAHHERMKTLVNRRARGVSTRFLAHYLTWLRLVRRPFGTAPEVLQAILSPT